MAAARSSELRFLIVAMLVFMASIAATICGSLSMSSMPGMEMPGGWTMSMAWMRMPGQSWSDASAMFLGMWVVMMIAMMLPALTPALLRYRRAVRPVAASGTGRFTAIVAIAYFSVWTLAGVAVFPLGVALAEWTMNAPALSRAVPFASGIVLIAAGAAQFTAWKTRELRCCRGAPACAPDTARGAWQHGLRLGVHCVRCCAGLTSVLLISGVMDLRVMAIVTLAITAERVTPSGQCIARLIGTLAIAAGLTLLAQT